MQKSLEMINAKNPIGNISKSFLKYEVQYKKKVILALTRRGTVIYTKKFEEAGIML